MHQNNELSVIRHRCQPSCVFLKRAAGCEIPVVGWDHCPERVNGRDNGPILRYFSACRSPKDHGAFKTDFEKANCRSKILVGLVSYETTLCIWH